MFRLLVIFISFVFLMPLLGVGQKTSNAVNGSPMSWNRVDVDGRLSILMPEGYKTIVLSNYQIGSPDGPHVDKRVTVTRALNTRGFVVESYQGNIQAIEKLTVTNETEGNEPLSLIRHDVLDGVSDRVFVGIRNKRPQLKEFVSTDDRFYVIGGTSDETDDALIRAFAESAAIVRKGKQIYLNASHSEQKTPNELREELMPASDDATPFAGEPEKPVAFVFRPGPVASPEVRKKKLSGEVQVRVFFSSSGRIAGVEPVSGNQWLVPSVINAANAIQFLPAENGGRPVSIWKTMTYTFSRY